LQPNELAVGASITVATVGAPYNGTFTILALPQYEFIGVDSNGFLEYNEQNPIADQVLYACTGTDQDRTQQFTGTIDDTSVSTWITANEIATFLGSDWKIKHTGVITELANGCAEVGFTPTLIRALWQNDIIAECARGTVRNPPGLFISRMRDAIARYRHIQQTEVTS